MERVPLYCSSCLPFTHKDASISRQKGCTAASRNDAPRNLAHVPIIHRHRTSNQLGRQPSCPLKPQPLCDTARALRAASCFDRLLRIPVYDATPPSQRASLISRREQGNTSRCSPFPFLALHFYTLLHTTSSQGRGRVYIGYRI